MKFKIARIAELELQKRQQRPAQPKPSAPRKRKADAAALAGEQGDEKRCSNCGTTDNTGKAWRRHNGARMCNACGVYPKQKEHLGEMRPISCIEKGMHQCPWANWADLRWALFG